MMSHVVELFFVLMAGHAVADFALQSEWVAKNKNRHVRELMTPEQQHTYQVIWPHLLTAHALMHGVMVYLITQNTYFGIAETVLHWIIDFGKCEKWYGFHTDQFLHIGCKVLWVYLYFQSVV